MFKLKYIAKVLFTLCLFTGNLLARDGLSIGVNTGFEADPFKYGQKYGRIAINNGLLVGTSNFWNDLDSAVSISKVYVDTQITNVEINGITGIAVFDNF